SAAINSATQPAAQPSRTSSSGFQTIKALVRSKAPRLVSSPSRPQPRAAEQLTPQPSHRTEPTAPARPLQTASPVTIGLVSLLHALVTPSLRTSPTASSVAPP